MERERFIFVCAESESGRDAFVTHPATGEEGRVDGCFQEHMVVQGNDGKKHCWDFHECEEMARSGREWPWR